MKKALSLALVSVFVLFVSEHNTTITTLLQLSVALSGLYLVSNLLQQKGVLPILAHIIAGIAVANVTYFCGQNQFLEFIQKSHFWHYMGEFLGLGLLFYSAGLETDVKKVQQVGVRAVLLALLGMVFVGLFGYLGLMPFGLTPIQAAFVVVGLVPTSAGVPMLTFAAKNMSKALVATFILVAAIADDILSLVLLSVLEGASTGTVDPTAILQKVAVTIGFLLIGSLVGYLANRTFLYRIFHDLKSHNAVLIVTLLWGLIFGVIAYFLGVNPVIGTYTAGLFLQKATFDHGKKHEELEHLVTPLVTLFSPIFFMWVGMNFLIAEVTLQAILFALILLVALFFGKLIAAKLTTIGSNSETKAMTEALCFGMFARVEVSLIIVSMGMKILPSYVISALILLVILSVLISIFGLSKWIKDGKVLNFGKLVDFLNNPKNFRYKFGFRLRSNDYLDKK